MRKDQNLFIKIKNKTGNLTYDEKDDYTSDYEPNDQDLEDLAKYNTESRGDSQENL